MEKKRGRALASEKGAKAWKNGVQTSLEKSKRGNSPPKTTLKQHVKGGSGNLARQGGWAANAKTGSEANPVGKKLTQSQKKASGCWKLPKGQKRGGKKREEKKELRPPVERKATI